MRLGIAVPKDRLFTDLAQMLAAELTQLGGHARRISPADVKSTKLDVVLLVGEGARLEDFIRLVPADAACRPVTLLWQLDPLPPLDLNADAEKIGLRLAKWDWNRIAPALRPWIKRLVPSRNKLMTALRAWTARGIRTAGGSACDPFEGLPVNLIHFVMAQWAWIRHHAEQGRIDHIMGSAISRVEFLQSRGVSAEFVPVGYHRGMGRLTGAKRDIDVLFLGAVRKTRRVSLLKQIEHQLAGRSIRLVTVSSNCFGQQRTELLNRARIVLNLLKFPWDLPGMRFLMSMSCGALVVTERLDDPRPYRSGIHLVEADSEDIPAAIAHYLEHEDERRRIVDAAHRFVTRELTLGGVAKQIMGLCEARCPVSTGAACGGDRTSGRRTFLESGNFPAHADPLDGAAR